MSLLGSIISIIPAWLREQYDEVFEKHEGLVITTKDWIMLGSKFVIGAVLLFLFTKLI